MRSRFPSVLAAGVLRDRLSAPAGAVIGIAVTGLVTALLCGDAGVTMLLVAPMGASAVLVFAVPASPLAQPWPVIGGNVISALVGVAVVHALPGSSLAAPLAVGGAILAMALTRSLHPPGGAAALTAVIGGAPVLGAGYAFAFVPVGVNAVAIALVGVAFHRLSGHSYPHRAPTLAAPRAADLQAEDIDRALAEFGDTLDIDRDDVERLVRRAEHHAATRRAA
ncbi:HPP family protein [uncultured Sphingomonas sp.]|uniref:HPP family protein n=1 Tax=uncultured Sphingomonas sp. TaxID=158754 RepID=UPI0026027755|nr:HPP family protein [uncultured Sphingomonas sp.]